MGLTFKKKDSLEKMFEEFAIEPKEDKKNTPEVKKETTTVNFSVNQKTEDKK
ncbi:MULTISPECIES: SPJ_0845 family protein [Vagococcus]|uniref:SPJ_0845 family protein n=1 Tax=Vagococcus TaxID=2737 RepID=UPI001470AE43|nr:MULTISPECIES: SPJ_0845 family protein [Vagococcus]